MHTNRKGAHERSRGGGSNRCIIVLIVVGAILVSLHLLAGRFARMDAGARALHRQEIVGALVSIVALLAVLNLRKVRRLEKEIESMRASSPKGVEEGPAKGEDSPANESQDQGHGEKRGRGSQPGPSEDDTPTNVHDFT